MLSLPSPVVVTVRARRWRRLSCRPAPGAAACRPVAVAVAVLT
jgi:hypothetical protein